jgi:TM2 domain-containing membrane protein YozV
MYSVIAHDGQAYGPVDIATLIQWCIQGRIVDTTTIMETYTGRTFTASQMPELQVVLTPATQYQNPYGAPAGYPPQGQAPLQQPYQPPHQPPLQNPYQQPYAGGLPSSPQMYGMYPGQNFSTRSKLVALLLCFFLGGLGAHRFYLGHTVTGAVMLLIGLVSCGMNWYAVIVIVVWSTIDMIMLASGSMKDAQGLPLR